MDIGYRMYVEDTYGEKLLCGGKLFGYVPINLCESYSFLKGYCYFTDQLIQLQEIDYLNPCSFKFPGKIIKEFLNIYSEDFKKLRQGGDFEYFDEFFKNLNDNAIYVLAWRYIIKEEE